MSAYMSPYILNLNMEAVKYNKKYVIAYIQIL